MALLKCHECGNEVSSEASACTKCGAKVKKPTSLLVNAIVAVIGIILVASWASEPPSTGNKTPQENLQPTNSQPALVSFDGKYPSDILDDPRLNQQFRELLDKDYEIFVRNLTGVAGAIEAKGNYYIGAGCAPRQCTEEEAAFAISKADGSIQASLFTSGSLKSFAITAGHQIPPPLAAWNKEHKISGVAETAIEPSANNIDQSASIEKAQKELEVAMQDPRKVRLMECIGVNPWKERPSGWTPPTEEECIQLKQLLGAEADARRTAQ